jgi:hypothetical protein
MYTMGYYSVIKRNEIMWFAGKWMELEIMLNEISQTKKNKYLCSLLYAESIPKKKTKNDVNLNLW